MELVEFLLARIGEDEAAATDEAIARARAGTVVGGPGVPAHAVDQAQEAVADVYRVRPWTRILSPARVLAECAAKRRIVEMYAGQHGQPYVLHFLALPYADHPDYQREWER
jgi:hypothetical protein